VLAPRNARNDAFLSPCSGPGIYLVATAETVPTALALFRSRDFDLVVTDHLLGRETGTSMA
jgi:CheY-like chemotaxis protein